MADVGTLLRAERERRGLSLRAVAARVGVSHVYIGEVERGVRPPSEHITGPLATLYGLDPARLRTRPSRAALAYLARHPEALAALERDAAEEGKGPACGGAIGLRCDGAAARESARSRAAELLVLAGVGALARDLRSGMEPAVVLATLENDVGQRYAARASERAAIQALRTLVEGGDSR
jgi:transcriptional regulator with XRE-family HTH domain